MIKGFLIGAAAVVVAVAVLVFISLIIIPKRADRAIEMMQKAEGRIDEYV